MEHENCRSHAIAYENIIVENGKATAICYKGLLWMLNEVGVQKTVQESNHPNGMHSVYDRESFHQHIVIIRWKKFNESRVYIRECQEEIFLKGSNEIFEAIVHVMYLHHIMNCTGTRGVLEKTMEYYDKCRIAEEYFQNG